MMILKYIPNALTIMRLILILPFLTSLYQHAFAPAFYIFLTAGCTDALDGWIARSFKWQSAFGSFIDPLADKFLIVSSFVSLAYLEELPWWLVSLVFMRDITIFMGILVWFWFVQRKLNFEPTFLSKINTVLQLTLITLCMFKLSFLNHPIQGLELLILLTAITTSASYLDYFYTWGKKTHNAIQFAK